MSAVSKLCLALLLVFVFFLLGLSAEILYMLCYRRRLRRAPSAGDPELCGGAEGGPHAAPSNKELLLCFLCCKNQCRVEPTSASAASSPAFSSADEAPPEKQESADDRDLATWRAAYFGMSRVLYTIREEEWEGAESDAGAGPGEEDEEEEAPFSTPCASPAFYTPTSSPTRSAEVVASAGAHTPAADRM